MQRCFLISSQDKAGADISIPTPENYLIKQDFSLLLAKQQIVCYPLAPHKEERPHGLLPQQ